MNLKLKRLSLILINAAVLTLAGCGGGSDSDPATGGNEPPVDTPTTTSISGTAAVGAPLAGSVTVKDALGATKTAPIGENGSYSVDVTGMTAPFVFRATGTANGQTYTVHSIATAADVNGKINITQLTDLVVANIAGQIAQNYFDKFNQDSNANAATKAAVDAEVVKLKEKLLPVLLALGVEAGVDLLRTPFTPHASALDTALDAIHVSVDSASNVATISTLLNNIAITDSLAVKAAEETAPETLSDANVTPAAVATSTGDATLVKKAITDFGAAFANGLPTSAQVAPLLTTGFMNDDEDRTAFLNWVTTESMLVGVSITDIVIHGIDYSDPTRITARVSFTLKTKDGHELGRLQNWRVRKSATDNAWRLHGNQRALALEGFAGMHKHVSAQGSCVSVGLNFNIEDFNTANNSTTASTISYILVTGPGLPNGGLRYVPQNGGRWTIDNVNNNNGITTYMMASNCNNGMQNVPDSVIASIPANAVYTFTAYDSSDAKVSFPTGTLDGTYSVKIPRGPMTLAETAASTAFPVISDATLSAFSSFESGTLSFSATNVNPAASAWVYLFQGTSMAQDRETEVTVLPTAAGAVTTSLSMSPLANGDSITSRTLWIESPDAYERNMQTIYQIYQP